MPLIALDGLDGCGKSTVIEELKNRLLSDYREVHVVHFPSYSTPIGKMIKQLLQTPPDDQMLFSLLFEVNRREELPTLNLAKHDDILVLADRYWMSGLSYALARNLSDKEIAVLLNTMLLLPKPDYVFILDIDPKVASDRMKWKTLDSLERNISFQSQVRYHLLNLAYRYNWHVIDASSKVNVVVSDIIFQIK